MRQLTAQVAWQWAESKPAHKERAQKLCGVSMMPRCTCAVHVRQAAQQLPHQGLGQGLVQARGRMAQQVSQVPRAQFQHQRAAAALRRPWLPLRAHGVAQMCCFVVLALCPRSALAHSYQFPRTRLLPCMHGVQCHCMASRCVLRLAKSLPPASGQANRAEQSCPSCGGGLL